MPHAALYWYIKDIVVTKFIATAILFDQVRAIHLFFVFLELLKIQEFVQWNK